MHICASGASNGIPINFFGNQYARTGNAYAGFYVYDSIPFFGESNYREYIQGELLTSLKHGKRYCVEFYVSLSDSSRYAINSIGIYFSTVPVNSNHMDYLPLKPHIETSIFVTNSFDWEKINGSFYSQGDELYFIIGNFNDSVKTKSIIVNENVTSQNDGYYTSYYYIDDIFVWECTEPVFLPNVFTPNADGVNDEYIYTCPENEFMHLAIYNRWGKPVFESSVYGDYWDGIHRGTGIPCTAGVYYAMLKLKTETIKSALQLFR